jgi:hypothetical protein
MYLRSYWWYVYHSTLVITHNCCQIQCPSTCLSNDNSMSCKIQCNCNFADSTLNIHMNVSPLMLLICRLLDARYTAHCCRMQGPSAGLCYVSSAPIKYIVIVVLHIPNSNSNWTYLRCYWWYVDHSIRVTLLVRCQIHYTSIGLRNVNSVSSQIYSNCSFAYLGLSIQLNVSPLLLGICRQFDARY